MFLSLLKIHLLSSFRFSTIFFQMTSVREDKDFISLGELITLNNVTEEQYLPTEAYTKRAVNYKFIQVRANLE